MSYVPKVPHYSGLMAYILWLNINFQLLETLFL